MDTWGSGHERNSVKLRVQNNVAKVIPQKHITWKLNFELYNNVETLILKSTSRILCEVDYFQKFEIKGDVIF